MRLRRVLTYILEPILDFTSLRISSMSLFMPSQSIRSVVMFWRKDSKAGSAPSRLHHRLKPDPKGIGNAKDKHTVRREENYESVLVSWLLQLCPFSVPGSFGKER